MFSQINPFSQYVIQDIYDESQEESKANDENKVKKEDKNWTLHEKLFKKNATHEVDPKILDKSSY